MKLYLHVIIVFSLCQGLLGQDSIKRIEKQETMDKPILGLRTVCYLVPDMAEAKIWYTKAFGTEPYFDEPFYMGFNIGGYELGLQPEENAESEKSVGVLAYWGVEDIHKQYNRMLEIGATTHEEPTNVGGDLMVASVKDPWGNIIGLIYNPAFKVDD